MNRIPQVRKTGSSTRADFSGKGDLAVMSIEVYEQLAGRSELYGLIQEGIDDIKTGNTRPFTDAMAELRNRRK